MAQSFQPLYADTEWAGDELNQAQLKKAIADFKTFVSYHYIPDKNKKMVRMELNAIQEDFAKRVLQVFVDSLNGNPHPATFVVLKSRRVGITFVTILLEQYIAMRKRNLSINHLFPNNKTAAELFNTSVKELYSGLHPQLMPQNSYTSSNGGEVKINRFMGVPIGSKITYGSFETNRRGIGSQMLVLDEWASAKKPGDVERGFINTVPKTGFAIIIYISTADGINHFYDLWKEGNKPGSGMICLFYPWHEVWWNTLEPSERLKKMESLTTEEAKLIPIFKKAGYPAHTWLGKLAFYDKVIKDASGDMDKVHAEWPSTPEESFDSTGKPVLPIKALRWLLEHAKAKKTYEYIDMVPIINPAGMLTDNVAWQPVKQSCVKQYKAPEIGHRYVIGIDPSSGLENSDFTAMVVVDEKTLETVCTFYGRIEDEDSAVTAVNLAKYYNMACLVPERNMGQALIAAINNIGYPRLYVDPRSGRIPKYGMRTDIITKDEGLKRLRFFILKGLWKTKDEQFLDDAMHFQYTETASGRQKAEAVGVDENHQPYHDDSVLACVMVCLYLDMRRWRSYLIYRDGDKRKGKLLAEAPRATLIVK